MRIIGGWARSRRLRAPAGAATRPTADRVREAVFNILGPPPPGARVLDLFAGAGTLGLEAISRGAEAVVFVERAPAAVNCLRDNIASLGVRDQCEIVTADVSRAIGRLGGRKTRFDWVFADPPYRTGAAEATLVALGASELVADGGRVVIEHDKRESLPEASGGLERVDQRIYGDTAVSFYGRVGP